MVQLKDRITDAMKAAGRDPAVRGNVGWLAGSLGISYNAAKKLLDGRSATMKAETATLAVHALGCNLDWLVHGAGEMKLGAVFQEGSQDRSVSIEQALPVLLDAIEQLSAGRWAMIRARLDRVAGQHEMSGPDAREEVTADLMMLLGPAVAEIARERAPAISAPRSILGNAGMGGTGAAGNELRSALSNRLGHGQRPAATTAPPQPILEADDSSGNLVDSPQERAVVDRPS